mgnify:CR=1 FL=1
MEDYSIVIQSFISLFEVSGEEEWLTLAGKLTDYSVEQFFDEKSGLFYLYCWQYQQSVTLNTSTASGKKTSEHSLPIY